jgi:two-component system, response regulator
MSAEAEILFIENDLTNAVKVLEALKSLGRRERFLWVRSAEDGLEHIFGPEGDLRRKLPQQFRGVIMDLRLPGVTGHEVLKAIKSHPRARVTPIVILTGSKDQKDLAASERWGALSYLAKPVTARQLESVLEEIDLYWRARRN